MKNKLFYKGLYDEHDIEFVEYRGGKQSHFYEKIFVPSGQLIVKRKIKL